MFTTFLDRYQLNTKRLTYNSILKMYKYIFVTRYLKKYFIFSAETSNGPESNFLFCKTLHFFPETYRKIFTKKSKRKRNNRNMSVRLQKFVEIRIKYFILNFSFRTSRDDMICLIAKTKIYD